MKHPLDGAIEQHSMIEVGYLPIEPHVNPGDRRVLKFRDFLADWRASRRIREQGRESIEGKGGDQIIETLFGRTIFLASANAYRNFRRARRKAFNRATEMKHTTARSHVIAGRIVEIGEWQRRYPHVPGFRRLHRLAHNLRRSRDRNALQFLAQ